MDTTTTHEQPIGLQVKQLRQAAGLSQARLAQLMKDAGHATWHRNTVARVEQGTQELRQSEGETLFAMLGQRSQSAVMRHAVRQSIDDELGGFVVREYVVPRLRQTRAALLEEVRRIDSALAALGGAAPVSNHHELDGS